jgi:biopolymer transport protein ExbD
MNLRTKDRRKGGEHGMTSMTDIIFIWLMFFMMTSTLTAPSALNLELPGKSTSNAEKVKDRLSDIGIEADGAFLFNRRASSYLLIQDQLKAMRNGTLETVYVTVSPSPDAPVESVVKIMDLTYQLGINAILNTAE